METKIKLNRIEAIQIHDCVRSMLGSPSYQLLRQEVCKKIEEAWPEILVNDSPTDPTTIREINLNAKEQRSIADGFVGLFNRKDGNGEYLLTSGNFSLIQKACKICKVWNWVKSNIDQDEIPDFQEPLDDEMPISDEEVESSD